MAHCWEEYLWKAHKACAVDPWASNVQLLDVLIQEKTSSWFLHHKLTPSTLSRAGSMFSLGTLHSCKPKVSTMITTAIPAAQSPPAHENSESRTAPATCQTLSTIKASNMPDMEASVKSSTSLMASLTGGSSASAQFDVKGSKTVTCNVSGVESQRVDVDALMELVIPHTSSGLPAWQPDISLPQLQWSSKRGQTLWVVTEIMYASSIKIQGDNQAQSSGKAKVSKGMGLDVSEQVGTEKEGMWRVTAPTDKSVFPFALRLHRLRYEGQGSLIVTSTSNLKRNSSLNSTNILRALSSKHLSRSSSLSQNLKPSRKVVNT